MGYRRGFSLIEVLVAMTLIGIGFSLVFAGMSSSLRNLGRTETNDRCLEQARQKLAELDLIKRIRLNDTATGSFEDGVRWTLQSVPFIAPVEEGPRRNGSSVIRIDLTVECMGRTGTQKRSIETYRFQTADNAPVPSLQEQLQQLQ
jgi:prepilin-type N-terminal cleavage/methylation domain-containing protein